MSDLCTVYKELLASNEGDILVKLKDGKQLKIISFLIKKRSPIFKTMSGSSMQETASGVVDLSRQYSLEAFREFMAHIYYNKQYTGSYVPLLFEILRIADYYEVADYRGYISDRIIKHIMDVPICLTIASESLKHGTLTSGIYAKCVGFLKEAVKPQKRISCDKRRVHVKEAVKPQKRVSCDTRRVHKKERRRMGRFDSYQYGFDSCQYGGSTDDEQVNCIEWSEPLVTISDLPDFIVDDVSNTVEKAIQQLSAIAITVDE